MACLLAACCCCCRFVCLHSLRLGRDDPVCGSNFSAMFLCFIVAREACQKLCQNHKFGCHFLYFLCPGRLPPESWHGRLLKNLIKIINSGTTSGNFCARAAFPRNLGPGGLSKTSSKSYIWAQFRVIVVPGQRETTRHGAGGTELQTLCCYACYACFVKGQLQKLNIA